MNSFWKICAVKGQFSLTFNSKASLKIKDLNKNEKRYFKNYNKQYGIGSGRNDQCPEN